MSSMIPSARVPRAGRKIARATSTRSSRTLAGLLFGIALGACSNPPPLDQAIKCDQFKRLPDGSWVTTADVSLDYTDNGVKNQDNFSKGVTLSAGHGDHDAMIVAGLEKKCSTRK